MKPTLFCILLSVIAFTSGKAQARLNSSDSSIIGTWKGSSLCQVKNSPCHDEIAIYHISKGQNADSFIVKANKLVNGVEEEMGTLVFKFERKTNQLVSADKKATWTFNIKNKAMDGTLVLQGALYRIIKLSKQQ